MLRTSIRDAPLYNLIRTLLFCLPAEFSHNLGLRGLKLLHGLGLIALVRRPVPGSPREFFGIRFANPVGLAAGLDKNADYLDALGALGFGFLEVGTVTPRPQPGNPRPRLFRLTGKQALINRMGFNNKGLDHMLQRLKRRRYSGVVGVNIGKNFDTPLENALDDYLCCFRAVYPLADYVVLNLSSPNTPGLRDLQSQEHLDHLLANLRLEQDRLRQLHHKRVPLLVKIAPDLDTVDIKRMAESFLRLEVDGVIATNTTVAREDVSHEIHGGESGGLSGAPLQIRSNRVIEALQQVLRGRIPIIGVGGIMDGEGALAKIRAGASLVQLYTGFIYRGPGLISEVAKALDKSPG